MPNPFARPDQPDSDETIPLVPDSGYAGQPSPWSSGYESTAIDPLTSDTPAAPGGYTNPVVSSPGGYTNPVMPAGPSPYPPTAAPAPAPSPFSLPPTASPLPPYAPAPTAPAYEQPPAAYGAGPFEPARDGSAQVVPAYSYVYGPQQIEHPNAIPTLVLGVLGFVFGVTFPIAWYLGAKGNAEVKRNPQRYRPSGMMTVGMVLGIIGSVFMMLAVLVMVLGIVALVAMS